MALILALALPSGAAVLTEKALAEEIPAAEAAEENAITFTTYTLEGRLYISGFSCKTVPETLTIPSKINGVSVYGVEYGEKSDIGDMSFGAFDLKGVKNLVIEDGIRYLTFFSGTQNLESVTLPASVEAVVSSCFYGAKKLKSINLENVKRIGSFAFCGCKSLTEVNLNGTEKLGELVFGGTENLTIAGHMSTAGEKYALENRMKFRLLRDNATPRPITVDGIEYDASESDSLGLFKLGLMKGVSVGEDGKVDFDLFRTPSRVEAVTMLVRLLGKDAAAAEMANALRRCDSSARTATSPPASRRARPR